MTGALLALPIDEILRLWTDLEEARLGSNTAEIYAFRLHGRKLEFEAERDPQAANARDQQAASALFDLLLLFRSHHPGVQVFVDGVDSIAAIRPTPHRWHIRIVETR
jgi:hypothetical protein